MFERYTQSARLVIFFAREEAQQRGSPTSNPSIFSSVCCARTTKWSPGS